MQPPTSLEDVLARVRAKLTSRYCFMSFWLVALLAVLATKSIPPTQSTPQAALPVSWMTQVAALSGKWKR